jgi:hypothetical protein
MRRGGPYRDLHDYPGIQRQRASPRSGPFTSQG